MATESNIIVEIDNVADIDDYLVSSPFVFARDTQLLYHETGAVFNPVGAVSPNIYSPDVAYPAPSTQDDEFNAGALDAKWNSAGVALTLAWDVPNHISLTGTHVNNPGAYIQSVASADITFAAKFALGDVAAGGGAHLGGLVVKNSVPRYDTFNFITSNGNNGIFIYHTAYTTFDFAGATPTSILTIYNPLLQPNIYLKIVYTHSGTNLKVFISYTGLTWYRIFNAATYGSGTITDIGFMASSNTAPLYIDWFRVLQGTSFGGNF